jgi:orotate phosphoribosyltransferase
VVEGLYLERLKKSGALVEGHFVFVSGRHSAWYINKMAALVLASDASIYAQAIAGYFRHQRVHWEDIVAVIYPELGAIKLGTLVANQLYAGADHGYDFPGIVATKIMKNGELAGFEIARDQARFIEGKRTLIVEDVITTGLSIRMTMDAVKAVGGTPVAIAALCIRNHMTAEEFGVEKLVSLVEQRFSEYPGDDCPLCRSGVPINTDLGKGAEFLKT